MMRTTLDLIAVSAISTRSSALFGSDSPMSDAARLKPLPGRPKAAKAPLGGSAACEAAQRGGVFV